MVADAEGELPVAKLQRAGRVIGRLVDEDGVLLPRMSLIPWSPPLATPADFDRAEELLATLAAERRPFSVWRV